MSAVFGAEHVFADNVRSMLVAVKPSVPFPSYHVCTALPKNSN